MTKSITTNVTQMYKMLQQMKYLLIPEGTAIGSCANTLLIPLSATIFALAMGSMMSSAANLSNSAMEE